MPAVPYIIQGFFKDYDNATGVSGAIIYFTLGSETLTETADSLGYYNFNAAALSDFEIGITIKAYASNGSVYSKVENLVCTGDSLSHNFTFFDHKIMQDVLAHDRYDAYAKADKVISVGKDGKPIIHSEYLDLINNPSTIWVITRGDGQPDSETITLSNGDIYKRTFTYNSSNILIGRSSWAK